MKSTQKNSRIENRQKNRDFLKVPKKATLLRSPGISDVSENRGKKRGFWIPSKKSPDLETVEKKLTFGIARNFGRFSKAPEKVAVLGMGEKSGGF